MSSSQSNKPQNPSPDPTSDDPKTLNPKNPDQKPIDPSPSPSPTPTNQENKNQEQEQEQEGECGFCLFMKSGACREVFIINWENCIEEGEKNNENIVDKCFEVTSVLKKCMEANSDYYAPVLQAEKAAEQEAINQLNKEKAAVAAAAAADSEEENPKPESKTESNPEPKPESS